MWQNRSWYVQQTEYANEEKNLNELKEQVKDVTKERVQTQINGVYPEKRNLEENREKTREAYHNYEKQRDGKGRHSDAASSD